MSKHIVIFSHGFGVRKDSRGLFRDIAAALSAECILFDYNQYSEATNSLTVAPLTEQAKKLRQVIDQTRSANPAAVIDLVCHSQGSVVAGLVKPTGIRKIILTGPPASLSKNRMADMFGSRPGAHLDFDGTSRFPRRDGSTTILPKEYWTSIENIDPTSLFNGLTDVASVTVVQANQDEVIGDRDFSRLSSKIKSIGLDANHDFSGDARPKLIQTIIEILDL